MTSRVLRTARQFGEDHMEDPTVEIEPEPPEPTFTEERQRVVRIARYQYAAQLLPVKVLLAALVVGLYVDGQDWSPWGVLPWTFVFAVASFLFTEWRLGGRHLKSGRIDWGNPRGRKQRRIRQRALRSACMGALVGVWLIAVALTDPGHASGTLVWLAGAGLWATISYHGWWGPAEDARSSTPIPAGEDDDLPDLDLEPVDPASAVAAAPAAAPYRPRRTRGGVPVPAARASEARANTVAAATEAAQVQVPDLTLLKTATEVTKPTESEDLTAEIQRVLDEHHLDARVVEAVRAPAVTRYGIQPGPGQQVDAIIRRKRDFAMACGTRQLEVYAPIEGRTLVGVEVPNRQRTWVTIGEALASREAQRDPHPLLVAIGKDADGGFLLGNLQDFPHVLLAGETGGGKSNGIDSMNVSILTRATPDEVRFLFVDVKRVELTRYEGIPHLLMPVITKAEKAADALQWVIKEMDLRYDEMQRARVKHIDQLNEKIINGTHKAPPGARYELRPFPYWVIVVDELADLLMLDDDDAVEDAIIRIAQLARAAGIHLVLATQNPLATVLTSRIKANIPCRFAYRTQNHQSSQVILDETGAEKLLGKGDAIIKLSGKPSVRVQGCMVDEEEVDALVKYWRDEAAKKGLAVPQIQLASTPRDEKPDRPRVTAYESVRSAAVRLANPEGLVSFAQIESATPGLGESARRNALTTLFQDEVLAKIKGQQAVFVVLRASKEEPLETKEREG